MSRASSTSTDEAGEGLLVAGGGGSCWLLAVGCWQLLLPLLPATSYQLPAASQLSQLPAAPARPSCELRAGDWRVSSCLPQWSVASVASCQLLPLAFGVPSGLLRASGFGLRAWGLGRGRPSCARACVCVCVRGGRAGCGCGCRLRLRVDYILHTPYRLRVGIKFLRATGWAAGQRATATQHLS
jgi:hypothetical protein